MKSPEEEFCKAKFSEFLERVEVHPTIEWKEVQLKYEPPDYYLSIDNDVYAVEVTVLLEYIKVGSHTLPNVAITSSLWQLVDEVELTANRNGFLQGAYVVGFQQPIENLRDVKNFITNNLLKYISETQSLDHSSEEVIFEKGGQQCSIQKIHNLKNKIYKGGPIHNKWEGEAAEEICVILEERINAKKSKLEKVRELKILLLYDGYHFACKSMFIDCIPNITDLPFFHTVFVVRGEDSESFILYSKRENWV